MGLNYSPRIITSGLILYLDAANPKSYPGTGTSWSDLSSNRFSFLGDVMPAFNDTPSDSFILNSSGDLNHKFQSTTNSGITGNSFAITVNAWIKEYTRNSYSGILTQNNTSNSMAFIIANGYPATDHWSPGGMKMSSQIALNTWVMVTWVVPTWATHKTATTIYLNGTPSTSAEYGSGAPGSLASLPLRVGNWAESRSDMEFKGEISNVSAYNRTLTSDEIKQNYNALKGRFGL